MKSAQTLRSRIPHARLVVIDRAAHLLLEERPEACVDAIRGFLRESLKPAQPAAAAR
jgi:pimeloyl-ACP methyl ester carboxylesterase